MRVESLVLESLRSGRRCLQASRGRAHAVRFPKAVGLALVLGLAVPLLGCAKVPIVGGEGQAKIQLSAGSNTNNCGKDQGYPLTFRVLQLSDASPLTGVTLVQLWDHEDKLLGGAFVTKSGNEVVDPGANKEVKVDLDEKTRAVVLVGNFCKTSGSCWYHVAPRKAGQGVSMKVIADGSCLRVTR